MHRRTPWRASGPEPRSGHRRAHAHGNLYSESASRLLVAVAPDKAAEFEALFGASAAFIGEVTSDARLTVASADSALFSVPVEALAHAFKATLDW